MPSLNQYFSKNAILQGKTISCNSTAVNKYEVNFSLKTNT